MNNEILEWLAQNFEKESDPPSSNTIEEMLSNQRATVFLLVWPILEQRLFDGFFTKGKIINFVAENKGLFSQIDADDAAKHFHNRYQDTTMYRRLRYRGKNQQPQIENAKKVDDILAKPYTSLLPEDKLHLLLYVTYRFRNNIFHGNKGILSWCQYGTEIDYCIRFMTKLVDAKREK